MKKRIFASTCAACCLLALAGCGASGTDGKTDSAAGEATGWTDGTYTETATGKNGDFEVTVVIQDGNIASVTVGDNQEDMDKGGVAIAQLPDKIVEAQSYEVDAVSGATITSEGIKSAVAKSLEQATK